MGRGSGGGGRSFSHGGRKVSIRKVAGGSFEFSFSNGRFTQSGRASSRAEAERGARSAIDRMNRLAANPGRGRIGHTRRIG